jgi:D-arabinose 1-dehydrogenase-like Zn-dependent alcohol dehydrogenase
MQKAIAVTRLNSPAVLVERPIPNPEENQLLVQVTATGCKSMSAAGNQFFLIEF